MYFGKKRFKELKDLKAIGILNRKTFNIVPINVEYSLTDEASTLKPPLLDQMRQWSIDFKLQVQKREQLDYEDCNLSQK